MPSVKRPITRKTLSGSHNSAKRQPQSGSHKSPTIKQKQASFKKFSQSIKPGGLHRSLGVPIGQKIGLTRIRAAAKRPGLIGKQGRAALGLLKGATFKKKKK